MNQLFRFNENNLRVVMRDDQPWFVASDVCLILEIGNVSQAVQRLDQDEKGLISIDTLGGSQSVIGVNESGLYELIFGSRKKEARDFKNWVKRDVLPSIRKTGSYSVQSQIPQTLPEALRLYAAQLEETQSVKAQNEVLEIENTAQKQQLKEQETPIAIYNLAIAAQNTQSMADVAKALGTGRTRLFGILREEGIIPDSRTVPYQRYIESGYFVVRERPRASGDTVINDPVPRVTAKGFDYIARLLQRRTNPGA